MSIDPTLQKVYEALEEHVKTGNLDKLNSAPPPVAGIGDGAPTLNKSMTRSDLLQMRKSLSTLDENTLSTILNEQASRRDQGIPLQQWAAASGKADEVYRRMQANPELLKAVDSSSAGVLIRQDLDPVVHALFVKRFPAWDRFRKVPSNGLVHWYNQITSYGDAQFISELGTVVDDQNVYDHGISNIGVLARRVGVSLKSQFAVQQGGAGYNLMELEMDGALTAMAHKLQKTIFQGNAAASGGTADDEYGAYDANAFTGLRQLLRGNANNTTLDISSATLSSRGDVTDAINTVVSNIGDSGGNPSVVYSRFHEHTEWNRQNNAFVRIINSNDRVKFVPGVDVTAIATNQGILPYVGVPGDSIGYYDNVSNKDVADIYVLDESQIVMPYLGSDSITTIEVPLGVGGQLVNYFIVYIMIGLAVTALPFQGKVVSQFEA